MKAFKATAIFFALMFIFSVPLYSFASECDRHSWYCKRTQDHSQPPIGSDLAFIEKYGAVYLDKKAKNDKVIYLTFDAGYENGNVEKILDVMKENGVKGAFFILDNLITRNPDLVKRMSDEGHLVCNHTTRHPDMSKITDRNCFREQLEGLEIHYKELTGKDIAPYYRPPEGRFSERNLKYAEDLGYKTVFWSFAYADWDNKHQMSEEKALEKILANVHNGEIMLLHPTSSTNAAIMDRLIKTLKSQGYRFETLDKIK